VIAPTDIKNNHKKPRYKLLPPPPATKGGVPQTVIGSAKPITTTQGGKEGKPGNGQ
jgi:hypothetical protein